MSPKVKKFWHLLEEMQKLIDDREFSPNKAAVMIAKDHWRDVSKSKGACVQWLKDNQRKFRNELDPWLAVLTATHADMSRPAPDPLVYNPWSRKWTTVHRKPPS